MKLSRFSTGGRTISRDSGGAPELRSMVRSLTGSCRPTFAFVPTTIRFRQGAAATRKWPSLSVGGGGQISAKRVWNCEKSLGGTGTSSTRRSGSGRPAVSTTRPDTDTAFGSAKSQPRFHKELAGRTKAMDEYPSAAADNWLLPRVARKVKRPSASTRAYVGRAPASLSTSMMTNRAWGHYPTFGKDREIEAVETVIGGSGKTEWVDEFQYVLPVLGMRN